MGSFVVSVKNGDIVSPLKKKFLLRENNVRKLKYKPLEGRDFVLFSVVSLAPIPNTLELNKSGLNDLFCKLEPSQNGGLFVF